MVTSEDEIKVVELRDDFYRDSFGRVIFVMVSITIAIGFIIATSIYLYVTLPPPVVFAAGDEWRLQPDVPVNQSYLSQPELLQWVTEVIPKSFTFDFIHYSDQLKNNQPYYTPDGWRIYQNQLNNYISATSVQSGKLFVTATPTRAPNIIQQGILSGNYAWWIELPIDITSAGINISNVQSLTLQVLVVRVSTLDNLTGVAIQNIVVTKSSGNTPPVGTV